MSRRPARFTQADVARAIRAVKQTGSSMAVEVAPDGTIRLVPVDISKLGEPTVEMEDDFVL